VWGADEEVPFLSAGICSAKCIPSQSRVNVFGCVAAGACLDGSSGDKRLPVLALGTAGERLAGRGAVSTPPSHGDSRTASSPCGCVSLCHVAGGCPLMATQSPCVVAPRPCPFVPHRRWVSWKGSSTAAAQVGMASLVCVSEEANVALAHPGRSTISEQCC